MRIHSLTMDNVRGVEHLELTDIPDTGVILIHGENEAGKSTILDGLDAVLTVKHDSSAAKARALRPIGRDELPEVRLEATIGPYTFTIWKRFGGKSKGKAELTVTAPRPEELTGEAAHNRLNEIIATHLDRQLFDALFLRQGHFSDSLEAAGIPAFTRALEASGASASSIATATEGGLEDSGLMQRVDEEFKRYFTNTGKDGQVLKEADAAVSTLEQQLHEAESRLAAHEAAIDEYAQRGREIEEVDAELPRAEQELAEREEEAAAAGELAATLQRAEESARRATTDLERAQDDAARRAELITSVEDAEKLLSELAAELEPAEEKAAVEKAAAEQKEIELTAAREAADAARTAFNAAEETVTTAQSRARLNELKELMGRVDAVDEEIDELLTALPERPVTADDVRALENATGEVALQRTLVDAAAARVELAGPPGAMVTVNGQDIHVPETDSIALHEGTEMVVGEVTLTYRAAPGTDTASSALREAEEEFARVAQRIGCEDVDQARELRDEHRDAAAHLQAARTRRADILRGAEADELRLELGRLDDKLDPESPVVGLEEATEALDEARMAVDAAYRTVHELEVQLSGLKAQPAATALAAVRTRVSEQEKSLAAHRASLAGARDKLSDDDLSTATSAAGNAHQAALAAVRELAEQVAHADPEHSASLRDGAQNRVDNLIRRHTAARDRRLQLEATVTGAEGEAEVRDRAAAELAAATVRRDRLRRRAEAAKLLRETLRAHRDAARAKYAEPFAQALQRHASRVFGPGTQFTLDDSLRVTARTLDGTTVGLEQLSGGAKEQMGLLTRFAIADLVAAADTEDMPVPVVIDDALGASDPQRLELMNALFTHVGHNSQVFVLTCYPQRFDRVAAAKTASIQELKDPN